MGHHKKKNKHKKDKKHKKRKHHSSSSLSDSSEDEWVEKETVESSSSVNNEDDVSSREEKRHREDSMMFVPDDLLTTSHLDRRREREESKRKQREADQYNPRENPRELNPYWKKGGDGLPSASFLKPSEDSSVTYHKKRQSNWRIINNDKNRNDFSRDTDKHVSSESTSKGNESTNPSKTETVNMLAARLIKAEILGDESLVNELKKKLELARKAASEKTTNEQNEEVILTRTDSKGFSVPIKSPQETASYSKGRSKKHKVETHSNKQRVRYFPDDDKYSLHQMFEAEKFNTAHEQNAEYLRMISKVSKNDDEDDVFTDKIRSKESDAKSEKRNKEKAINEHRRITESLDNCNRCLQTDSMLKHLMVSMGETMYLSVPPHEALTDGHCLIVPVRHTPCSTQLDENEWSELMNFRKALTAMFSSLGQDVIFFESAIFINRFPHMKIECIPVPKETGDLAPIYFKKAIDESETEWASNKKLVSLKGRDVRRAVPKGLPYFFVSFGMEEGYAHVVEDEKMFPNNFAQEIIGGMLDLHHSKWRKPKRLSFDEQSKNVLHLSKLWTKFDCTVIT